MTDEERRAAAEAEWLAAARQALADNSAAGVSEQVAYEKLADLCSEMGQCQEIGCREQTTDKAYCTAHRH